MRFGFAASAANAGDKLAIMGEDRRADQRRDRRAHPRGGRRDGDSKKPWYMRRRLWLATASVMYVAWRRVRNLGRREPAATSSFDAHSDSGDSRKFGGGLQG